MCHNRLYFISLIYWKIKSKAFSNQLPNASNLLIKKKIHLNFFHLIATTS